MMTGRAAGIDEVTTEMIRAAVPIGSQWIYRIFRVMWQEKKVPEDLGRGIIVPVNFP